MEQQIFKQIDKADKILITFSADWRGDAVGSALALSLFLKKIGKEVDISAHLDETDATQKKSKEIWRFLPAYDQLQTSLKNLRKFIVSLDISQAAISQIKYTIDEKKLNFIVSPEKGWFSAKDISSSSSGFKYDLIICVDTSDLESLGSIYDNNVEFFYKTTIINIDHHAGNEEYGQINMIDLNLVSTAEIVFALIKHRDNNLIDEDIATCLLAGIISKTNNYKSSNLTPRTLLSSSKLISLGARREDIINQLYRSRPLSVLKLWGKILNNLQADKNKQLIWSLLDKGDSSLILKEGVDLQEIVEEIIISVPEAKVVLIALDISNKESLELYAYTTKGISALETLKPWSGSGNNKMAKATVSIPANEISERIITPITIMLDKINS
ncbi:MAG: DHH family phosphoesterase [Patescibacteria group bacterium]|nr:DHH family phosphoesterase [Patescibacteria group bacterium]